MVVSSQCAISEKGGPSFTRLSGGGGHCGAEGGHGLDGRRVAGVGGEDSLEIYEGLGRATTFGKDHALFVEGHVVAWIEGHGLVEGGKRLVLVAAKPEDAAKDVVRSAVFGFQFHRPERGGARLIGLAA